ncbi:MAG: hypothetical protein NTY75_03160 [Candidatus Shapirobacteria bacterium]|nr:hypothetical protein [Candidatus Shapirobacteria bacterium]
MSERGKFVVLEGIDGSGKGTQVEWLERRLKIMGKRVKVFDFPRYEESMAGALVGRMLTGEFGDPANISPYLSCLPYVCDEVRDSDQIREWTENGGLALSNRYFTSNVHQIGKQPEGEARDKFRDWLWKFGYEEMGIKKPDLVVALLVDIPICRINIEKKAARKYTNGQGADLVERDVNYQIEAAKEYRRTVEVDSSWVAINCCLEGKLMPEQEVHELVFNEIQRRKIV